MKDPDISSPQANGLQLKTMPETIITIHKINLFNNFKQKKLLKYRYFELILKTKILLKKWIGYSK